MDDYIVKPVKKEELEAILMKYLGRPARSRLCETRAKSHLPHVRPQTRPGS
jgi:YesN/AraC family two-component response regulator